MFNTGNCASVPLVANIDGNGNNNGWGAEGSWLWFIIVIFAIFGWGGFGNGFGGNGMNGGVGSEIQRGFDNQAVVSKLDGMEYMRDMDKSQGKMYYSEPIAPHVSESNYDRAKRHYTETKEMHKGASTEDKEHKMKALDMYIRELSGDISELLNDMTPDERNLLRTKMSNLASKL